jgi:hypothetical protein
MKLHRIPLVAAVAAAVAFVVAPIDGARAGVSYDWVCTNVGCDGDPGFSFSIEFSNAAVAAGSFTGMAGNILSVSITSSFGDGYSNTLADLAELGGFDNDQTDISIAFSGDRQFVDDFLDFGTGVLIWFNGTEGDTLIGEGTGQTYFIDFRRDHQPVALATDDDIQGVLVRRAAPEPATLAIVALGLAGMGVMARRRRR